MPISSTKWTNLRILTSHIRSASRVSPGSMLLFLLYINDINNLILSPGSKLVLYANDIPLYRPIVSENDYTLLQRDVDALGVWSLLNFLSFNIKKCKSMTLCQTLVSPAYNLYFSKAQALTM